MSGGVISLSSYLLASWEFTPCHLALTGVKINSDTPILLCHGAEDEKVSPVSVADQSEASIEVTWPVLTNQSPEFRSINEY